MVDIEQFRKKTIEEIRKDLAAKRKELVDFAKSVLSGKEKNVVKTRTLKREYAKMATVLNEKLTEGKLNG